MKLKLGKTEGKPYPIIKGDVPLDTYSLDHLGPITSIREIAIF